MAKKGWGAYWRVPRHGRPWRQRTYTEYTFKKKRGGGADRAARSDPYHKRSGQRLGELASSCARVGGSCLRRHGRKVLGRQDGPRRLQDFRRGLFAVELREVGVGARATLEPRRALLSARLLWIGAATHATVAAVPCAGGPGSRTAPRRAWWPRQRWPAAAGRRGAVCPRHATARPRHVSQRYRISARHGTPARTFCRVSSLSSSRAVSASARRFCMRAVMVSVVHSM